MLIPEGLENGLSSVVRKYESIKTHNFADASSWKNENGEATPNDSSFHLFPPDGEAFVLAGATLNFSEGTLFNNDRHVSVEYYIRGSDINIQFWNHSLQVF